MADFIQSDHMDCTTYKFINHSKQFELQKEVNVLAKQGWRVVNYGIIKGEYLTTHYVCMELYLSKKGRSEMNMFELNMVKSLKTLETKLLTNKSSSFELDRDLGLLIGGWKEVPGNHPLYTQYPTTGFLDDGGNIFPDSEGSIYENNYTSSIDDAIGLLKFALPDWTFSITDDGAVYIRNPSDDNCFSADLGLAYIAESFCLAIVRAKIDMLEREAAKPKVKTQQELIKAIATAARAVRHQKERQFMLLHPPEQAQFIVWFLL
jgi:hypothetical protein